jgi:hypothetical protein
MDDLPSVAKAALSATQREERLYNGEVMEGGLTGSDRGRGGFGANLVSNIAWAPFYNNPSATYAIARNFV